MAAVWCDSWCLSGCLPLLLVRQCLCNGDGVLDPGNNWRAQKMLSSQVVASLSMVYSSCHWPRPWSPWCSYKASTRMICRGPLQTEQLCETGNCSEHTAVVCVPRPSCKAASKGLEFAPDPISLEVKASLSLKWRTRISPCLWFLLFLHHHDEPSH